MKKYYTKKTPKCRQLTLKQIYGVQNNTETKEQRKEAWGDDKAFLESLQEIGRSKRGKENHRDRG